MFKSQLHNLLATRLGRSYGCFGSHRCETKASTVPLVPGSLLAPRGPPSFLPHSAAGPRGCLLCSRYSPSINRPPRPLAPGWFGRVGGGSRSQVEQSGVGGSFARGSLPALGLAAAVLLRQSATPETALSRHLGQQRLRVSLATPGDSP